MESPQEDICADFRNAYDWVRERFPFRGYMSPEGDEYFAVMETVCRYLSRGGRILDFGSGPCDKTAILQRMGFRCAAVDDLGDYWHGLADNRERILQFARESGVDFKSVAEGTGLPFAPASFDLVMLHDVLEHLHDSPRGILNDCLNLTGPEGYLFVTVPNAANVRKRLSLLFGRTNMPSFASYYWASGKYRGHVREYVKRDLEMLCEYQGLIVCEIRSCHQLVYKVLGRGLPRVVYQACTAVFQGWRDTWLLVARKRPGWTARDRPSDEGAERALRRKLREPWGSWSWNRR